MSKLDTLILSGASGFKHNFNVWPINTKFNSVSAIYAIAERVQQPLGNCKYYIYYIGRTDNLFERLNGHHKLDDCVRFGANCVCVHQDSQESSRVFKEVDLVRFYKPKFNELLKYS